MALMKSSILITHHQFVAKEWVPRGEPEEYIKYLENPLYSEHLPNVDSSQMSLEILNFYTSTSIDIPSRPPWTLQMTKGELEDKENVYFKQWLEMVYETCPSDKLGFFEHNLEVWRQFWRVCEISDIIVVVLDARFPILHYPTSLHRYLLTLEKPIIITLMKCDLIDEELVKNWKTSLRSYFQDAFPIIEISIFPLSPKDQGQGNSKGLRRYKNSFGVSELLRQCASSCENKFDEEWGKILKKSSITTDYHETSIAGDFPEVRKELVTIGMLGHPNVGKSSLINSIVGRKVVSASKTPGHTKHFQTIHLSKHIRLCDCPGLIFPVALSRDLQILNGLFNVAQVRDPFGPLLIASSLINLPIKLNLSLPNDENHWTILLVCQESARQKGFYTSKAGRPDAYRAANLLLRMILDGRLLIAWRPVGYNGPVTRALTLESESERESSSTDADLSSAESTGNVVGYNPFDSLLCEE